MRTRLAAAPLVAVLGIVLGTALVAGCGSDGENAKTLPKTAATTASTAVPTPTSTVPGPTEPATPSPAPADARVRVESGLPSGFPKAEIPVIAADVINGTVGEPGSRYAWTVVLQPKGDLRELTDQAASKLEAAGFTAGPKTELDNLQVRQYTNAKYEVGFTATQSADGVIATYVVTKR